MRRIAIVFAVVSASVLRPNAQAGVDQFISAIEGPQSGREGELAALPLAAMAILKAVQDKRFGLDDDVNKILTSWKVPASEHTVKQPVTLRGLLSHTSGTDDGFGFPGYKPGIPVPSVTQILNGEPPSNVRAVVLGRPPLTAFKYSGGGFTLVQLLLTDATERPFPEVMQEWVLEPIGMTSSAYEQPLSAARHRHAARHRVLSRAMAIEMATPVGVGPYGLGIAINKDGEGWYLEHGGSNWGFQCMLVVHKLKGYGFAAMANSDSGGRIIAEIEQRVAAPYQWDTLDKPLRR